MGALTLTKDLDRPRRITRHLVMMTGTVTLSASYAAGGDTGMDPLGVTATNAAKYLEMDVEPVGGYVFEFDKTNLTLKCMCPTGKTAPTAIGDPLTSIPSGATAVTSTAAQPTLTETGGRGVEMGATANLSTLVTRYRALGKK